MTAFHGSIAAAQTAFRLFRVPPRARTLMILTALALLTGLDQTLFRGVIALLRQSHHLLNEDLGVAARASAVASIVTLPLGGFLAHLFGPRRVLLAAGGLTALAGCGMGFVFDARGYAVLCLVLGLGAGTVPGAAIAAIGFWFAPQEQGKAIASLLAAPLLGSLAATLLVTDRTEQWTGHGLSTHWQGLHLAVGILAIAWCYGARQGYGARPSMPGMPVDRTASDIPLGTLWPLGVVRRGGALLLLAFTQSYASGLGGAWLAARLFTDWHLDIDDQSFVTLSGLCGSLGGVILGGVLTDLAFRHSGNVKSARQVVIGIGFLLGAVCLLPLRASHDAFHAGLWRGMSLLCLGLPAAPLWSIALTIAPGKPGPVLGMLGLGTALGLIAAPAALAPWLGGWGWSVTFWIGVAASAVCGIGAFGLDPTLEIEKPPPKAAREDGEDD